MSPDIPMPEALTCLKLWSRWSSGPADRLMVHIWNLFPSTNVLETHIFILGTQFFADFRDRLLVVPATA